MKRIFPWAVLMLTAACASPNIEKPLLFRPIKESIERKINSEEIHLAKRRSITKKSEGQELLELPEAIPKEKVYDNDGIEYGSDLEGLTQEYFNNGFGLDKHFDDLKPKILADLLTYNPIKAKKLLISKWVEIYQNGKRGFIERSIKRSEHIIGELKNLFEAQGVKKEDAFVAIPESGFQSRIISYQGGVGLYQFIKSSGRQYGLIISKQKYKKRVITRSGRRTWVWRSVYDERTNPYLSAAAAARYLKAHRKLFEDDDITWASYNSGKPQNGFSTTQKGESKKRKPIGDGKLTYDNYLKYKGLLIKENLNRKGYKIYRIRRGDTLGRIAKRNKTSVRKIKKINHIRGTRIYAGQKIKISGKINYNKRLISNIMQNLNYPSQIYAINSILEQDYPEYFNATSKTTPKIIKHTGYQTKPVYYKVRKGDTLGRISNRTGISIYKIKKANNIRGSLIRIGEYLTLRGKRASIDQTIKHLSKEYKISEKEFKRYNSHLVYAYSLPKTYHIVLPK